MKSGRLPHAASLLLEEAETVVSPTPESSFLHTKMLKSCSALSFLEHFQFVLCVPGAEFLSGTSLNLPFFTSSLCFCLSVCVCVSGVPGPEHRGDPHRLLLGALRHHAGPDGPPAGHLRAQLFHSAHPHLHGKLREERPAGGRLERRRAGGPSVFAGVGEYLQLETRRSDRWGQKCCRQRC